MKQEVTFANVEQKYHYAAEHIDFCRDAALDDAPLAHDWQDRETLARWLYGAIKEFEQEYLQTAVPLPDKTETHIRQIAEWSSNAVLQRHNSWEAIIGKYSSLAKVLR